MLERAAMPFSGRSSHLGVEPSSLMFLALAGRWVLYHQHHLGSPHIGRRRILVEIEIYLESRSLRFSFHPCDVGLVTERFPRSGFLTHEIL